MASKGFVVTMIVVPILAVAGGGTYLYMNHQNQTSNELATSASKTKEALQKIPSVQKEKSTSETSAESGISESSVSSSEKSEQSVSSINETFDHLPQTYQLAMLAEEMYSSGASVPDDSAFKVYMGTPDEIVIWNSYGNGGWVANLVKFVDNHDGSFDMYYPVSSEDNADADDTNTKWQHSRTITKQQMLSKYYSNVNSKSDVRSVADQVDMSSSSDTFDYLP